MENPQENCFHENDTEVADCTVFFSVCKPLPSSICGASNVSYCEVVTATNGTKYTYNIGSYTKKHNFLALRMCAYVTILCALQCHFMHYCACGLNVDSL